MIKFSNGREVHLEGSLGVGAVNTAFLATQKSEGETTGEFVVVKAFRPKKWRDAESEIACRFLPAEKEDFVRELKAYKTKNAEVREALIQCAKDEAEMQWFAQNIPGEWETFEVFDEERGTCTYLTVYPYKGTDLSRQDLAELSLVERLKFIKDLCRIVNLFHKNQFLLEDLKPENVIFLHGVQDHTMLFDFDSLAKCDAKGKGYVTAGSKFFSAPEVLERMNRCTKDLDRMNCLEKLMIEVDRLADMYSLGAMLVYAVFCVGGCFETLYSVVVPSPERGGSTMTADTVGNLLEAAQEVVWEKGDLFKEAPKAFWERFYGVVKKAMHFSQNRRSSAEFPAEELANEVQILIEIIENKGIHPEVMREKAEKLLLGNDDFDARLFAGLTEDVKE